MAIAVLRSLGLPEQLVSFFGSRVPSLQQGQSLRGESMIRDAVDVMSRRFNLTSGQDIRQVEELARRARTSVNRGISSKDTYRTSELRNIDRVQNDNFTSIEARVIVVYQDAATGDIIRVPVVVSNLQTASKDEAIRRAMESFPEPIHQSRPNRNMNGNNFQSSDAYVISMHLRG